MTSDDHSTPNSNSNNSNSNRRRRRINSADITNHDDDPFLQRKFGWLRVTSGIISVAYAILSIISLFFAIIAFRDFTDSTSTDPQHPAACIDTLSSLKIHILIHSFFTSATAIAFIVTLAPTTIRCEPGPTMADGVPGLIGGVFMVVWWIILAVNGSEIKECMIMHNSAAVSSISSYITLSHYCTWLVVFLMFLTFTFDKFILNVVAGMRSVPTRKELTSQRTQRQLEILGESFVNDEKIMHDATHDVASVRSSLPFLLPPALVPPQTPAKSVSYSKTNIIVHVPSSKNNNNNNNNSMQNNNTIMQNNNNNNNGRSGALVIGKEADGLSADEYYNSNNTKDEYLSIEPTNYSQTENSLFGTATPAPSVFTAEPQASHSMVRRGAATWIDYEEKKSVFSSRDFFFDEELDAYGSIPHQNTDLNHNEVYASNTSSSFTTAVV